MSQAWCTRRTTYVLIAIAAVAVVALLVVALSPHRNPAANPPAVAAHAPSSPMPATAATGTSETSAVAAISASSAPAPESPVRGKTHAAAPKAPPRPPASKHKTVELKSVPAATVGHLAGVTVTVPQTYLVTADVLGWQDLSAGVACLKVLDARLLGPVDPATGLEESKPPSGTPDHSAALRTLTLLSATSPSVRAALSQGVHEIHLILLPNSNSSTFMLDRVVR